MSECNEQASELRSRGMPWRKQLRAAFFSSLVLVCAACGDKAPQAGELRIWAMGKEGEHLAALLQEFSTRYPDQPVRLQRIPWSAAHEKLLTAFVAGTLPDVVQLGNTWIAEFAAIGALEPLDSWLAGTDLVADWFSGIAETNRVDGQTWAAPWYVDTRVLFYRRDLLAAAGVLQPPRTWAEWRDAMVRLRRSAPGRYALLAPLKEWQLLVALAFQQGATLLREEATRGNFQSPEFRRAFDFYVSLFREGLAPFAGEAQVANVYQDFAAGLFAFYVTGPWNLVEFRRRLPPELEDAWDTAPLPSPHPGEVGVSVAGGSSLAIVRTSPRKAEAWRLLEFLLGTEQQVRWYQLSGDLPARRSAWESPQLRHGERVAAFRVQLEHVRGAPQVPEWERIAALLTECVEQVVRSQREPAAALQALDAEVDAVLAKRRWLRQKMHAGEKR